MGYEDREYMRETGSGRGTERGSNPLWWILGLIVLILVVGAVRRGSMSQPDSTDSLAAAAGPLIVCEIEFVHHPGQTEALLPMLRSFFLEQGYDVTIHETADGLYSTASFSRPSDDEQMFQSISYQRLHEDDGGGAATHQLQFLVLRIGTADASTLIEKTRLLAEELHLRLEQELPGIEHRFDNVLRPAAYEDID